MEALRKVLYVIIVFWLTTAAEEPIGDITTEGFEFPLYETPEKVTEASVGEQTPVGDIPIEIRPETSPTVVEAKEEEPSEVQQQQTILVFPENHKNFTSSQFLGDEEFPPYYNHLTKYQQQYKNYNEQKQIFNTKPIKFEEDSLKNYYFPQNSLELKNDKKTESLPGHSNSFPYAFEQEKVQGWYKTPEYALVYDHQNEDKEKTQEDWYKHTKHAIGYEQPKEQNKNWYKGQNPIYDQFKDQNDKTQEDWYKHKGQVPVYEHPDEQDVKVQEDWYKFKGHVPHAEYVLKGHQEHVLPQYVFPYGYRHQHDGKYLKNEPGHYDHHHVKLEEKANSWKKVFHVLSALVPLGLLLATLTPNVISINSTTTAKTTRQRSDDPSPFHFKEEDVIKLMKKYGIHSLNEAQCEDRIICELAREGGTNTAGPVEKGFWFLANQTPWNIAEEAGMNDLFKAIKTGSCETYICHSKAKTSRKRNFDKKIIIRKHEITK